VKPCSVRNISSIPKDQMSQHFYGTGRELEMLEDAVEAADMAWWVMEIPSGAVFFSPKKIAMLGYDRKETKKFVHYTNFTDLLHPKDLPGAMKSMENLLSGKASTYSQRYRLLCKDGKYITFYDKGRIVGRHPDGSVAVAGIVQKIWQKDYQ
jgi:PAS domain S-box-containing protein